MTPAGSAPEPVAAPPAGADELALEAAAAAEGDPDRTRFGSGAEEEGEEPRVRPEPGKPVAELDGVAEPADPDVLAAALLPRLTAAEPTGTGLPSL